MMSLSITASTDKTGGPVPVDGKEVNDELCDRQYN